MHTTIAVSIVNNIVVVKEFLICVTSDSSVHNVGLYFYLLALVESSLEVLLILALLSRFFLQGVSLCLVWLEEGGDDEELVLARESSSDIPVWIEEKPKPGAGIETAK